MITNENSVGVSSNGANELMENVKINMSLTRMVSSKCNYCKCSLCVYNGNIRWIKTREKLESKKLQYCYEDQ